MRALLVTISLGLLRTGAWAQDAMPVKTVAAIRDATVYLRTNVDSETDGPVISGSGFVVQVDGTTAYVITNAHVLATPRGERTFSARPTTKVYFRSGTKSEARAVAEVVASAPERDLALLKVSNVPDPPGPIELVADAEPFETMTVYIFGFPFGERLALGKGNPPVNVGRGQVSSVRKGEDERLTSVLLDGALNPGNSGGPVVDSKGKLVGVARATIRGANIGFAIAVPEVLALLDGKTAPASLTVRRWNAGVAELSVEVPLLDPLARVKAVQLRYTLGTPKFSRTKRPKPPQPLDDPEDDGPDVLAQRSADTELVFGPIEQAEMISLRVDRQRATGAFNVAAKGKDIVLSCQASLVDAAGKTRHAPPGRYLFTRGAGTIGPDQFTFWGETIDPDGDCNVTLHDGDLQYEVPGTLHDLNVDIGKNNSPRVVQDVEGDFTVSAKVAGSFQPGPVRTGPKSVPYNGGGLLVWLDDGNYIRLERASMFRSNRVVGFVAFESRERGTRASVHNKGGLDPRRDLWLRLERRGDVIAGFISFDGAAWEALEPMEVDWPARLKVGTDAVNSCGDAMTVRFHDYVLTKRADRPPVP